MYSISALTQCLWDTWRQTLRTDPNDYALSTFLWLINDINNYLFSSTTKQNVWVCRLQNTVIASLISKSIFIGKNDFLFRCIDMVSNCKNTFTESIYKEFFSIFIFSLCRFFLPRSFPFYVWICVVLYWLFVQYFKCLYIVHQATQSSNRNTIFGFWVAQAVLIRAVVKRTKCQKIPTFSQFFCFFLFSSVCMRMYLTFLYYSRIVSIMTNEMKMGFDGAVKKIIIMTWCLSRKKVKFFFIRFVVLYWNVKSKKSGR